MQLLGITLKKPSVKDLVICLVVVILGLLLNFGMHAAAGIEMRNEMLFTLTAAFLSGSMTNAIGINIPDHGWRAMLIIIGLAAVLCGLAYIVFT